MRAAYLARWVAGTAIAVFAAACANPDCPEACTTGQECVAGRCRAVCTLDADCTGASICVRGYCEEGNRPPVEFAAPAVCDGGAAHAGDVLIDSQVELARIAAEVGAVGCIIVTGRLVVRATPLVTLHGLEGVAGVLGGLEIEANANLLDLQALANLRRVQGSVDIIGNDALASLGLASLGEITGDVTIVDNPCLSQSAIDALVAGLEVLGGSVEAHGNAP